jgi:hypothetical protein
MLATCLCTTLHTCIGKRGTAVMHMLCDHKPLYVIQVLNASTAVQGPSEVFITLSGYVTCE